jgi:sporulation protein YlmC with PRC-barrel domain
MARTVAEFPKVLSASTLKNEKVVNAAGEDLGKMAEYLIDLKSGRIAYCVLSFGGFLGMGDKLFAVPWSALTLDTEKKCFVLNVDKERLKNAPGFDKDNWPDMGTPEFGTRVHSFYNVKPYWE